MFGLSMLSGGSTYAPLCKILIFGKPIDSSAIISVSIDEKLDAPSQFTIVLNEEFNVMTKMFRWLENPILNPGNVAIIVLGYANGDQKPVMMGSIKAITPNFSFDNAPTLTVEGYDFSQKMQHKTTSMVMKQKKTYSTIAVNLASMYGLVPGPNSFDPTSKLYDKVERPVDKKDYDFLRELANEIYYEFFVQDNFLFFRKSRENDKPIKTFKYGNDIIRFNPRLSVASLVQQIEVPVWQRNTKTSLKAKAMIAQVVKDKIVLPLIMKCSDGKGTKAVEEKQFQTMSDAMEYAKVKMKEIANSFIQGDLECVGDPNLKPGKVIKISDVGRIFEGNYYITGAKNTFGNGYLTTLQVRKVIS